MWVLHTLTFKKSSSEVFGAIAFLRIFFSFTTIKSTFKKIAHMMHLKTVMPGENGMYQMVYYDINEITRVNVKNEKLCYFKILQFL